MFSMSNITIANFQSAISDVEFKIEIDTNADQYGIRNSENSIKSGIEEGIKTKSILESVKAYNLPRN